jgi:hypothetical protein
MSNDLIPADVFGEVSTQVASDEDFESIGSSSKFLRRLELKSKGALIDTGKVRPGHYCVVKSRDDADDLGDSIDLLVLARKPKAIDMSDAGQIIVTYDRNSEVFKDIEKRSSVKDSRCQFGVTFLVIERSTGKLYEFFCGTVSSQREIPAISDHMRLTAEQIKARGLKDVKPHGPLPLTLKSKRVEDKNKGYSWFVPVPKTCSNPFTAEQIPSPDVIKAEIEKFLAPDENAPKAEAASGKGRAR